MKCVNACVCACMCNDLSRFVFIEIQSRRQERKRRTTANPIYSGATFEPEVTDVQTSHRNETAVKKIESPLQMKLKYETMHLFA